MITDKALLEVNWALQEAYKIAVHHSGITDWSQEEPERKIEVEKMQIEIAKMILSRLPKSEEEKDLRK